MKALTPDQIRSSFVNATDEQLERMSLPGLHEVIWGEREYLGWRDPRAPLRGYIVHWRGDTPVGVVLRASDVSLSSGIGAMCTLCHVTQPSRQVTLFTAPRAGQPGLDGNTIGTYLCDDLACPMLIRILPAPSPMHPPPEEMLARRSEGLFERVQAFTATVARTPQ